MPSNGEVQLISKVASIVTTTSASTEIVSIPVPNSTSCLFVVDCIAQNPSSSGNMYTFQGSYLCNASGSVASMQGSGTAPIHIQPGSYTIIKGVTVGTNGPNFRVLASGSNTQAYRWE
ncbi:MAG: hypothetical protein AABY07_01580 [Nanoarchaeota archaeon]|mgnify:FL=1